MINNITNEMVNILPCDTTWNLEQQ